MAPDERHRPSQTSKSWRQPYGTQSSRYVDEQEEDPKHLSIRPRSIAQGGLGKSYDASSRQKLENFESASRGVLTSKSQQRTAAQSKQDQKRTSDFSEHDDVEDDEQVRVADEGDEEEEEEEEEERAGDDEEGPIESSVSSIIADARLPPELSAFCEIAKDDYVGCANFAHRKPQLWTFVERLPGVSKLLLRKGELEAASRVISRYMMLRVSMRGGRDVNTLQVRWIGDLARIEKERKEFVLVCNALFDQQVEDIRKERQELKMLRSTQPVPRRRQESVTTNAEVTSRHNVSQNRESLLNRRLSTASKGSRGYSGAQGSIAGSGGSVVDGRGPRDHASDFDSGSLPGGKAFIGPSGPETAVIKNWDAEVQSKLRKEYKIHEGEEKINKVFAPGCMIALLWHENLGTKLPSKYADYPRGVPPDGKFGPGYITQGRNYHEWIFSHIRRFVIVIQRKGHSIGIPITSYSKAGISAKKLADVERRAHAIIYDYATTNNPQPLEREPEFSKDAIGVDIEVSHETLSPESRLYYAKPQSIEHNVKVKYIGKVIKTDLRRLIAAFKNELFPTLD